MDAPEKNPEFQKLIGRDRLSTSILHSPLFLFSSVMAWVFVAEWFTMRLLIVLQVQDKDAEALLDAGILSLLCLPAAYAFLYRPLIRQVRFLAEQEFERMLLSKTIEQSSEVVLITDKEGTIEYVNPAFERNTGYTREEAVGKTPRILKSGMQERQHYQRLWDTISAGDNWEGHFINKKKDGAVFEESAKISPVFDESGSITHYVAVKKDVTERIRLEARLRQAQEMKAIGTVAGGIANEFDSILNPLISRLDVLLEKHDSDSDSHADLQLIKKGADRARNAVSQLIQFSRHQEGSRHTIDLTSTIEECLRLLRAVFSPLIRISQEISEEPLLVEADATQIHTVIMNLCLNARDAIPNGGDLIIRARNRELSSIETAGRVAEPGNYLCIGVEDTGVGMDEYTQSRMFDPFFTTREPGRGSGLGLSTIYGIVEKHGGFIEVLSTPGEGSTFEVFLPAVADEAQDASEPHTESQA